MYPEFSHIEEYRNKLPTTAHEEKNQQGICERELMIHLPTKTFLSLNQHMLMEC
jgi:hypothetical protein